ncbi:MAG: transglycosylase domain-containing protein [Actinomycetota bacterium]
MKTEARDPSESDEWTITPDPQKKPRRRWLRVLIVAVAALLLGPPILAAIAFASLYATTDIPAKPPLLQTTHLFDRDGKEIATLHRSIDRTVIPLSDMPESLRNAVIAVEDQDFYEHPGISLPAITRAAWQNFVHGDVVEGGSTITQQYVKNVYTGADQTYERKIQEAVLAMKLERNLSKDEILTRYLNTIYFGEGAYGVEAAARTYWQIPAKELNLLQSATLAGIIAAPSEADPLDHPKAATQRRNQALDLMAEQGYVSESAAAKLKKRPVVTNPERSRLDYPGAYFVEYTRGVLESLVGPEQAAGGGLRVQTTLDLEWQKTAEDAVRSGLPSPQDPEAALVAIDPRSGEVRALVGGRDFSRLQVNQATGSCEGCVGRETGSAFKPFTFAAALEAGISPRSIWRGPPEITIRDEDCGSEPWRVANYADANAGTMDLMDATANSVNTIFAQVVAKIGPEPVADVAHRMGIVSELQPVCSITLGTQSVTPLEMTTAFATLAAQGTVHAPTPIQEIDHPDGSSIFRYEPEGTLAVSTEVADLVGYALQGVVDHGTGVRADLGARPVAGKTGTSQNYSNAWFCGYVPQLAACIWVGYPEGNIPMKDVEGEPVVTGGSIPAEIWHDFMKEVTDNMPVEELPEPDLSLYPRVPLHSRDRNPNRDNPSDQQPVSPAPQSPAPPSPVPSPSPAPSPTPTMPVETAAGEAPMKPE